MFGNVGTSFALLTDNLETLLLQSITSSLALNLRTHFISW